MEKKIIYSQEIVLFPDERITYVYKRDSKGEVLEVTNVSYESFIKNIWITIVRYDSTHGYLHKHVRVSVDNSTDTPIPINVDGGHAEWLTWSVDDIKHNFFSYRKEFLDRSGMLGNCLVLRSDMG